MICKECGRDLPDDEFWTYPSGKKRGKCKECLRAYSKVRNNLPFELRVKKFVIPDSIKPIVKEVCELFSISKQELFSENRDKLFSYARKILCVKLREKGLSLPAIGRILKIDHTSVLYHIRTVEVANSYIEEMIKEVENDKRTNRTYR